MGEKEILNLLAEIHPRGMCAKSISDNLKVTEATVIRTILNLRKTKEIVYEIIDRQAKLYRINDKYLEQWK